MSQSAVPRADLRGIEGVTDTFTRQCECGETVRVIEGQKQPHTCRPISAQQVRDAWADGYEFARRELLGDPASAGGTA
jgi:hypothetical protein